MFFRNEMLTVSQKVMNRGHCEGVSPKQSYEYKHLWYTRLTRLLRGVYPRLKGRGLEMTCILTFYECIKCIFKKSFEDELYSLLVDTSIVFHRKCFSRFNAHYFLKMDEKTTL